MIVVQICFDAVLQARAFQPAHQHGIGKPFKVIELQIRRKSAA